MPFINNGVLIGITKLQGKRYQAVTGFSIILVFTADTGNNFRNIMEKCRILIVWIGQS
jgi:hypothetical protein